MGISVSNKYNVSTDLWNIDLLDTYISSKSMFCKSISKESKVNPNC